MLCARCVLRRGAVEGMYGVVGLGFWLSGQVAVDRILVSIDALQDWDDVQLRIARVMIQEVRSTQPAPNESKR